ncbi:MAG: NAD(+)/NADH kinase [Chloroflexota bacterium]|nr:NAD(+)/NADH kinase [Chloroflexota bacterium]
MNTDEMQSTNISPDDAEWHQTPPSRIGILFHPHKPESKELALEMAAMLEEQACAFWIGSAWDDEAIEDQLPDLDMLITLGGDGTILRAARLGASYAIPILGVKMGRLGFLAEVQPDDWRDPMEEVLTGHYWLERRLMLDVRMQRNGPVQDEQDQDLHFQALNDVVVSRGGLARLVRVATSIDGDYLTTYAADGVIVATPTGSTGYALAAGGPILPPELRNILLIPIAAHLSLDRAVVLSEGATVSLTVDSDHDVILTVDGQFKVEVQDGDVVNICTSTDSAYFVRLRSPAYFYRSLMERLKWHF